MLLHQVQKERGSGPRSVEPTGAQRARFARNHNGRAGQTTTGGQTGGGDIFTLPFRVTELWS